MQIRQKCPSFTTLLCSCTHMMSILCLASDAVSFGNWFIVFKVLTLNIAMLVVF